MSDQAVSDPQESSGVPSQDGHIRDLREQLKLELTRSLLLEAPDREYWLQELPNLPLTVIRNLLQLLAPANTQVDDYIETVLSQDQNQEHLQKLKQKVAALKAKAFSIEEGEESKAEKREEEELLSQLD